MKTTALIVTYGNRFHLLERVINACLKEGVNKILVIDNGSKLESVSSLRDYEAKIPQLNVIYNKENEGSAGGYKKAMEVAISDQSTEMVWLLDDDNMPLQNSLNELKRIWSISNTLKKENNLCLLSYRPDRKSYKEAVLKNKPNLVLGPKNSFLGFHIFDLPAKLIRFIKRRWFTEKKTTTSTQISYGRVAVAPYGGMYLHRNLIQKIGLPIEEFFVYADDHEWSYRITQQGGEIILALDSLLDDIDTSWNIPKTNDTTFSLIENGPPFRVYYGTRNRVYFETRKLITNRFMYELNKYVFLIFLKLMTHNSPGVKAFHNAVNDGFKGTLGNSKDY